MEKKMKHLNKYQIKSVCLDPVEGTMANIKYLPCGTPAKKPVMDMINECVKKSYFNNNISFIAQIYLNQYSKKDYYDHSIDSFIDYLEQEIFWSCGNEHLTRAINGFKKLLTAA